MAFSGCVSRRIRLSQSMRLSARVFARGMSEISYIVSPRNFGSNFQMKSMAESQKALEIKNVHPLDASIEFTEENHSYTINGTPASFSVTELASKFFSSFNADVVISKMMNGRNWPRAGYINQDGSPYTEDQIRERWEVTATNARNRGTWMHLNIERYLNGVVAAEDLPEFKQFRAFVEEQITSQGIEPYRTEWRIGSAEEGVCGTVDFIGKLPDGTFMLCDWKRIQNVNDSLSHLYGNRASDPFHEYDDCDGVKYMVQLNLYKHLLEQHYGLTVSSTKLVSFHPKQESYLSVEVPPMEQEIKAMFAGLRN